MKRLVSLAILAFSALSLNAQPHFKVASNPDILRHDGAIFPSRVNIVLPQVNGYNIYRRIFISIPFILMDMFLQSFV